MSQGDRRSELHVIPHLWLQILCPGIDYDDKYELLALCCLWCVFWG